MRSFSLLGLSLAALLGAAAAANAQDRMMDEPEPSNQTQPRYNYGIPGPIGAGFGPMMGYGQIMNGQQWGAGTMGFGMMGPDMMHLFLILMDADGDGALSLEEYQEAHARIFRYLDANGDGRLTSEELEAHMHPEAEGS